jgi:hypothetical protein
MATANAIKKQKQKTKVLLSKLAEVALFVVMFEECCCE